MTRTRTISDAVRLISPGTPIADHVDALEVLRARVRSLDDDFEGTFRVCRSPKCKSLIYWKKTRSGSRAPFDVDGVSHFSTCPDARSFRRS